LIISDQTFATKSKVGVGAGAEYKFDKETSGNDAIKGRTWSEKRILCRVVHQSC